MIVVDLVGDSGPRLRRFSRSRWVDMHIRELGPADGGRYGRANEGKGPYGQE